MARRSNQGGFTIVEVIVTLVVMMILLFAIWQSVVLVHQISRADSDYRRADLLAYNLMREYENKKYSATALCNAHGVSQESVLFDESSTVPNGPLGVVQQKVVLRKPYGCAERFNSYPLQITVTVKYGTWGRSVSYATYIER